MQSRQTFYRRAVHVLSGFLVYSNVAMICLGVVAMATSLPFWLDVIVEDVTIGTTALNLGFIVIKAMNLNWMRNPLAKRIHTFFSWYLTTACFSIAANMLVTLVNVFVQRRDNPLHFLVPALSLGLFTITHLLAIAGGYLSYVSTRASLVCEEEAHVPVWRFECVIADDPIPKSAINPKVILKITGIGFLLLLLATAIYGPFIFLAAGASVEYWVAGNLSIFNVFLIVLAIFLLARQVPRTKRKLHRGILIAIIAVSGSIAALNAYPLLSSQSTIDSLDQQFHDSFGVDCVANIAADVSARFRDMPVALKDIMLSLPIPLVDERHDVAYMEDKGQTLRFDWYGPLGISATTRRLPLVIAIHGGTWRYLDKGAWNVIPTSRYIADQGYIVVDVQYGLHNDSAGAFTMKDMVVEIATLTRFLETNAGDYHVDLNRTFFLGRSVGAQLALVAGLAYESPYFSGNYSPLLDCRGIIAFYPPADLSSVMAESDPEQLFGVPVADFWHFNPV
ncbi:MAG: alpha/beta hydrolase, partial [Candidatus Lokiarchaeota archaeon]|nr:alpha/beta hydrolase [Candidatus Lokiarchaeota archaeon]